MRLSDALERLQAGNLQYLCWVDTGSAQRGVHEGARTRATLAHEQAAGPQVTHRHVAALLPGVVGRHDHDKAVVQEGRTVQTGVALAIGQHGQVDFLWDHHGQHTGGVADGQAYLQLGMARAQLAQALGQQVGRRRFGAAQVQAGGG